MEAPVIPISAQLKYNIEVICEYICKKIPIPIRDFTSEPRLIGKFMLVLKYGPKYTSLTSKAKNPLKNKPYVKSLSVVFGTHSVSTLTLVSAVCRYVCMVYWRMPNH